MTMAESGITVRALDSEDEVDAWAAFCASCRVGPPPWRDERGPLRASRALSREGILNARTVLFRNSKAARACAGLCHHHKLPG